MEGGRKQCKTKKTSKKKTKKEEEEEKQEGEEKERRRGREEGEGGGSPPLPPPHVFSFKRENLARAGCDETNIILVQLLSNSQKQIILISY